VNQVYFINLFFADFKKFCSKKLKL